MIISVCPRFSIFIHHHHVHTPPTPLSPPHPHPSTHPHTTNPLIHFLSVYLVHYQAISAYPPVFLPTLSCSFICFYLLYLTTYLAEGGLEGGAVGVAVGSWERSGAFEIAASPLSPFAWLSHLRLFSPLPAICLPPASIPPLCYCILELDGVLVNVATRRSNWLMWLPNALLTLRYN